MKTLRLLITLALGMFSTAMVHAQGATAFIYQGQLRDGGTNANGNYTMTFKLYDALSGGNQVSNTIVTSATLVNGIFSVSLDFGGGAFNGDPRWLETTVNNGSTVETISPRTPLLPAPYAQIAGKAITLDSGSWNFHSLNFQGLTNVFGIFDDGIMVIGMSTNGILVNGGIDTGHFNAGSASIDGDINVNNGSSIYLSNSNSTGSVRLSSDGDIGLSIGGSVSIQNMLSFNDGTSLSIGGQGSLMTSGDLTTSNIMFYGNTLRFPSLSGATMIVQTNGDFVFDNNIALSSLGVLRIPTPGQGAISLTGYQFGGGGGRLLGVDATVQADGLNIPNGSGGYVLIGASGGNAVVNGGIQVSDVHCMGVTASGNISANSFTTTSDRNLKENFAPIDSREILDRVAALPISRWNFKTDHTRHIGPMAQDFYSTFNVGMDDRHIATVDEDGVALAAIQGLNEKLKEKDAEIQALEKRLSDLEKLVKADKTQTEEAK